MYIIIVHNDGTMQIMPKTNFKREHYSQIKYLAEVKEDVTMADLSNWIARSYKNGKFKIIYNDFNN